MTFNNVAILPYESQIIRLIYTGQSETSLLALWLTVKHLISAVSNFRGLLNMTYWRAHFYFGVLAPDSKENLMKICSIYFLVYIKLYIVSSVKE